MSRLMQMVFAVAMAIQMAGILHAQQVNISMQPGPYYAGEPVLIQITAKGFDENPQPECIAGDLPDNISISQSTVSPSYFEYQQIINGRRTSRKEVTYTYRLHVLASEPGTYQLQPFTISQNQTQVKTQPVVLQFDEMEINDTMRVELVLPGGPVWPGQQVDLELQWWYAGELNEAMNLIIRCPMFDQFTFIDEPASRQDYVMPVMTAEGEVHLKATTRQRVLNGREYLVMSATRKLMVDQPGEFDIPPPSASIERVIRWRRGFFGAREPAASEKLRAIGKPQKLIVRPLPIDKAPPSFAGAVGKGFTIDVKADRTVVNAGDPITLHVTIRGDGNLDRAGLAPLTGAGLDPKYFRTPQEEQPGVVSDGTKQFELTVRVLSDNVNELPPITYSWFDPDQQQFVSTQSSPIALRVMHAEMVRAEDVLSSVDTNGSNDQQDQQQQRQQKQQQGAGTGGIDLTGADLAIERDVGRLLIDESGRYGGIVFVVSLYGASVLLIAATWFLKLKSQVDPEKLRLKKLIRTQLAQVNHAAGLPAGQGAHQIADALRRLMPDASGPSQKEIDRLLSECDTIAFAPDTNEGTRVDSDLHQRAAALLRQVGRELSV